MGQDFGQRSLLALGRPEAGAPPTRFTPVTNMVATFDGEGARGERPPLVVLDEIHKARAWKQTLKGVFDTLENPCDILVTGSARLDIYKRGGESLLGRQIGFRLHPFSVGELERR